MRDPDATDGRASVPRATAWIPALCAAFYAIFIARTGFRFDGAVYFTLFDDAMVSMRYARNLAEGSGLVWNPGEAPVEGYTNLLWTLWMALLHLVPAGESKVSLLVMLSGLVILLLNLRVVRAIAERVSGGSGVAVVAAMLFTGLYYPLAYWTLRGMEVGLLTLVVDYALLRTMRLEDRCRRRDILLIAALLAAGILVRPDGIVPAIVVGTFVLWTVPRTARVAAATVLALVVGAVIVAHTGFRSWYYGDSLPNTYYLKVTGGTAVERVARGLRVLLDLLAGHLAAPLILIAGAWRGARRRNELLLAAVFCAQAAYSVYVGGDAWEWMGYANRYLTVGMPALLVLSALAVDRVRLSWSVRPSTLAFAGGALSLAFGAVWLAGTSAEPRLFGRYALLRFLLGAGGVGAGCALMALALWWKRTRNVDARIAGRPLAAVASLALLGLLSGPALVKWAAWNAFHVAEDQRMVEWGVRIRQATRPDAVVAVVWAGTLPYFAHRPTVDLLGKSDPAIARGPAIGEFFPGHNKWNYRYSIGELRPDLVVQLWRRTEDDYRYLESIGYRHYGGDFWVREQSRAVDRAGVAALAATCPEPRRGTGDSRRAGLERKPCTLNEAGLR